MEKMAYPRGTGNRVMALRILGLALFIIFWEVAYYASIAWENWLLMQP